MFGLHKHRHNILDVHCSNKYTDYIDNELKFTLILVVIYYILTPFATIYHSLKLCSSCPKQLDDQSAYFRLTMLSRPQLVPFTICWSGSTKECRGHPRSFRLHSYLLRSSRGSMKDPVSTKCLVCWETSSPSESKDRSSDVWCARRHHRHQKVRIVLQMFGVLGDIIAIRK